MHTKKNYICVEYFLLRLIFNSVLFIFVHKISAFGYFSFVGLKDIPTNDSVEFVEVINNLISHEYVEED